MVSTYSISSTDDHTIVFDWNNRQNGALIGFIGVVSALLQGGYVRRATVRTGEGVMARRGITSCAAGLVLLTIVPQLADSNTVAGVRALQAAAVCLAFTSATVVNSLTSYASLQCDEGVDAGTGKPTAEHPQLAKGKALGHFRSSGQLGRAIGPLLGMPLPLLLSQEINSDLGLCSVRFLLDFRSLDHLRH